MNKFVRSFFGRIRGHQIFLSDYLTFILFKYCEMWCHHESQYCFDSSHFDFDFYCVPTSEFLVFSRLCFHEKNRFEIAHKICSHWLMTLKSLDGFCHASKHFFNENCKKRKISLPIVLLQNHEKKIQCKVYFRILVSTFEVSWSLVHN